MKLWSSKALALAACAMASIATARANTIVVDGQTREYLMHVPTGLVPQKNVPVLFALHGIGGTAAGMEHATGFDAIADANHFIVVYPQGLNNQWGHLMSVPQQPGPDLAFFKALFDLLISTGQVDGGRIYVTGFSMGAGMTQELACSFASRIAAVAPVSNTLSDHLASVCQPNAKIPVLEMHGTLDTHAPYNGGHAGNPNFPLVVMVSAPAMVAKWVAFDGCTTQLPDQMLPDVDPNDGSTVTLQSWTNCAGGSAVRFYKIINGGHFWPGSAQPGPPPGTPTGVINHDINASQIIWDFVKQFKRY
jgi:polyhydroxybutyrate depolymerase